MTMVMTHRERVMKALSHAEPDRVPIDLGGTDATGIAVGPYRQICGDLGLDVEPVYVMDTMQQCPLLHERLRNELGIDTCGVYQLPAAWAKGIAYDGTTVLYPAGFRPTVELDGSRVVRDANGDVELKMPEGGYYFEPVLHPLQGISSIAELEKAKDVIENYDRPSWLDMSWEQLALQAKTLRGSTDAVLIGQFSGHIFQAAQLIRGWEEFMVDLVTNPILAEALMDRLSEAHMRAFEYYARTVGQYVDIINICDDLGTQAGPWVSPEMYRRLVKPYQAKLYRYIKENCRARLWYHSDGSIYSIVPDLIEIGVDILNPIQFTAADMDAARLKREFGADVCFWGGGVDTQSVLPFGTSQQVEEQVKRRIDDLAAGGGFVFAAVHNIQEGVPLENILAVFRTAAEYGRY